MKEVSRLGVKIDSRSSGLLRTLWYGDVLGDSSIVSVEYLIRLAGRNWVEDEGPAS